MANKILAATARIFLASMWLGLASSQVYGQDETYCEGEDYELAYLDDMFSDDDLDDLDEFCDELLDYYLDEELDDYEWDWNELEDLETLHERIMDEFQDAGDTGSERAISYAELEGQMMEAGTTLDDVVWEALYEADELASLRPTKTWGSELLNLIFPHAFAGDGHTTFRTAKPRVETKIKKKIKER